MINSYERKTIALTARRAMRVLRGLIRHEYSKLRTESERLLALPPIPEVPAQDSERLEDDPAQTVGHQTAHDDESCNPGLTADAVGPSPSEGQFQPALPERNAPTEIRQRPHLSTPI